MSIINKILQERKMKGKDPCWKGYEMVGTKDKDGKQVPNCVPEETIKEEEKEIESSDYKTDKRGRKHRAHKIVFNTGEKMENSEPVKEEAELEEGTRFATAMKSAIAAQDRGDKEKVKYHLDNAKTARYSLKSTEITKHKDLLDKYKQMMESTEFEELTESSNMDDKFAKAKGDDHPFATSNIGGTTVRHYKSDDGYIGHAWETKNGQTQYHEHPYKGEAHAKKEAKKHVEFHNEPAQLKSQLKSKAYGVLRKDRKMSEHVELDEAMKPYVSGDHKDGWTILNSKGKEVKTFHHTDYVDHPIADRRSAAKNDAMAYLKKHFNKLSEGVETMEEGNFAHYVQKADAAKSKGDEQEAKHHLKYAERLYNTMSNDEKSKVAKHVNLYKQMSESFEQMQESTIKVGDSIVWNKGKTGQTAGKVHKIEGDSYILHHARTNTYHKVPKLGSEVVKESVETIEELKKSTVLQYHVKSRDAKNKIYKDYDELADKSDDEARDYEEKHGQEYLNRKKGLARSTARLTKEEKMTDSEMKERERLVKGMKKSYKDFVSQYGKDKAKDVMYATATKMAMAKEEFEEDDLYEEVEELDELSKATLASYIKKASRSVGAKRHLAGRFDTSALHKRTTATKAADERMADDFSKEARRRVKGIDKASDRLAKEEVESLDELSKSTLGSYINKAAKDVDNKSADTEKYRSKYADPNNFPLRGAKKEVAQKRSKIDNRVAGIGNAVSRLAKEEVDLEEAKEITHSGVKQLMGDTKTRDHAVEKVMKAYKCDRKVAEKHVDHVIDSSMKEEHIVESFDLMEGMIERDDFDDMLAARKKTAKVIDYKHTDNKAHITYVDGEGVKRTVKYTPTGKSMINHGPYEGGEQIADTKGKVNKTEVKTVKRGRGRPRKDKFAEAAEILVGLSEEDFSNLMENYSLDQLVDALMSDLEDSQ